MLARKSRRPILLIVVTAALILAGCNVGGAEPAPTMDINAVSTALVGTTVAQMSGVQTQTALAVPSVTPLPSNTPLALATFASTDAVASPAGNAAGALPTVSFNQTTNTPLAGFTPLATAAAPAGATSALGDACNNAIWIADIGVQDGDVIKPGTNFEKIWRVQNTGTCLWDDGYELVHIAGGEWLDPPNFRFTKSGDFVDPGEIADIGVTLSAPCAPGKYEAHFRLRNDKGFFFGTTLSAYIEVKEKCSNK